MKVQLISVPVGDLTQPYTSLPTLTAQLRRTGVQTLQNDYGIEFARYWLMPTRLVRLLGVLQRRIEEIELRGPSGTDWETYVDLKVLAAQFSDDGTPAIELLNDLRDRAVLEDLPRLSRLLRLLGGFQSLISIAEKDAFAPAASFHAADRAVAERMIRDPHFLYGRFVQDVVVPEILADRPDVLGISVTYPRQLLPALIVCHAIRAAVPGVRIVLGGAYLSTVVETFVDRPEIADLWDFIVDGEGETALVRLVRAIEEGTAFDDVPNLIFHGSEGATRSKRQRHEEDIHRLATPDFTGLNLASYFAPEIVFLLPVARGCYMRCTFCAISYATSGYRCRTGPEIVADIKEVQRQFGKSASRFNFSIDVMAPKHLDAMASALEDADLGITWDAEIRLDATLRSDIIARMRRAGCRHLRFGLESAVDRIRELMDKRVKIARVEEILRDCRAEDIKASTMLIVGFPGETEEEARETLRFVKDRSGIIRFYAISVYTVSRGSIIAERPGDFGVDLRPRPDRFVQPSWDFTVMRGLTTERARVLSGEFQRQLRQSYPLAEEGFSVGIGGSFTFLVADRWSWEDLIEFDGRHTAEFFGIEGENSVLELSARADVIRTPWCLPPPDGVPRFSEDDSAVYVTTTESHLLRLTDISARVLAEIDGRRSVSEIVARTLPAEAVGDEAGWSREVVAFLSSLVGLGILRSSERSDGRSGTSRRQSPARSAVAAR